jgi:hypothetical protein
MPQRAARGSRSFEIARRLLGEHPEVQGKVGLESADLKELVAAANVDAAALAIPAAQLLRDVFDQLAGPGWDKKLVASKTGQSLDRMLASGRTEGLGYQLVEPPRQWSAANAQGLKSTAPPGAAEWLDVVVARGGPVTPGDVRDLAAAIFPPDGDERWKHIDSDDFRWLQKFASPGWVPLTDEAWAELTRAVRQALVRSAPSAALRAWTTHVLAAAQPLSLADCRALLEAIPPAATDRAGFFKAAAFTDSVYLTLPMTTEAKAFVDVLSNMGLSRTWKDRFGVEEFVNLKGGVEVFAAAREAQAAYRALSGT